MGVFKLYESWTPEHEGGARDTGGLGVGLPLTTSLFQDAGFPLWASATKIPPGGIGYDTTTSSWYGMFCNNTDLFAMVRSNQGLTRGLYQYTINDAVEPMTIEFQAMKTMAELGLPFYWSGYSELGNCWLDDATGNVFLTSYYTAAYPVTTRLFNLGDWPFEAADNIWGGVPSSYGATEAGKIGYLCVLHPDKERDRLYVSSTYGGKVQTYKLSDGTYLGEFVSYTGWSSSYRWQIIGIDNTTGEVLAVDSRGTFNNGEVHRWNATDPNAWVKGDKEWLKYDETHTVGKHITGRPEGVGENAPRVQNEAHPAYTYLLGYPKNVRDRLGLGANEFLIRRPLTTYYGTFSQTVLTIWNHATGETRDFHIYRDSQQKRSGWAGYGISSAQFHSINGKFWMFHPTEGTPDHFADYSGTDGNRLFGVGATFADVGKVTWRKTVTAGFLPTGINHDVVVGSQDSEGSGSDHKHRMRMRHKPSGGSFTTPTGWRSGRALRRLQAEVDGDPPWPPVPAGADVEIEHEMQTGINTRFEKWCDIRGNPGDVGDPTTEQLSSQMIGPPRNISPELLYGDAVGDGILVSVEVEDEIQVSVEVEDEIQVSVEVES